MYGLKGFNILLASLTKFKDARIIFTGTNPDISNQKILKQIKKLHASTEKIAEIDRNCLKLPELA